MSTAGARIAVQPGRLWNRDFVLLWQGQLVSQLGSQAAFIATMLWTLEATGSPGLMALLMITSTLPAVLLGPVAGAVVDRHPRKSLLIGSDVVRGAAALLVGVTLLRWPAAPAVVVPLLFVSAVVSGVAGAVFGPAVRAALPDLVPPERLAAGNSLSSMGSQVSALAGLAAGGAIYVAVGPAVLFVADGVSYLLSAASESLIRLPAAARVEEGTVRSAVARYRTETAAGLRYCLADPGQRGFILLAAGLNFLFMPVFVLLPLYVARVLGAGDGWYGYLLAGLSAGSLAGLLAAGTLGSAAGMRSRILMLALLGTGACMAALGWAAGPWTALGLLAAIGLLTSVVNVLVITVVQLRAPPQLRGRALAVLIAVTSAATPLGLAAGGIYGELGGGQLRALVAGAGIAALALSAGLLSRRSVRAFLAG